MSALPAEPTADELEAHTRFLTGLARDLLRDEHLAEDVVQETLVAALTHDGPRPERPRAWLAGVLRNRFRMAVRGEIRRRAREKILRPDRGEMPPDVLVSILEVQRRTLDAVLALPEAYRSVVVRRYYHGLGPSEIARRDGVPVETVRTRLKRALARLRARLDGEHGGDRASWSLALGPLVRSPAAPPAAGLLLGGALLKAKSALLLILLPLLGLVAGVIGSRLLAPVEEVETPGSGRLEEEVRDLRAERDDLLAERSGLQASLRAAEEERVKWRARLAKREEAEPSGGTLEEPVAEEVAGTDWKELSRGIVALADAEEREGDLLSNPKLALEASLFAMRLRKLAGQLGVPEVNDVFTHPAVFPHLVKGILEVILPDATEETRANLGAEIADVRADLAKDRDPPLLPLEKRAGDAALAFETADRSRGRIPDEDLARLLRVLGTDRPGSYRIGWLRSKREGLEIAVHDTYWERLGLEGPDRIVARAILDEFVGSHLRSVAELERRLGAGAVARAFGMPREEEPKAPTFEERLADLEVRAKLLAVQAEAERKLFGRLSPEARARMLKASPQILLLGETR